MTIDPQYIAVAWDVAGRQVVVRSSRWPAPVLWQPLVVVVVVLATSIVAATRRWPPTVHLLIPLLPGDKGNPCTEEHLNTTLQSVRHAAQAAEEYKRKGSGWSRVEETGWRWQSRPDKEVCGVIGGFLWRGHQRTKGGSP